MSFLDTIIAFIILLSTWRGFKLGAMKTALALLSWFIALVAASRLGSTVGASFASIIDGVVLQTAAGFLAVFVVSLTLVHGSVYLARGALKKLKLDFLDKIAGAILGAATGLLRVLFALSIIAPLLVHLSIWHNSPLAQNLLPFAPTAQQLIKETAGGVWKAVGPQRIVMADKPH